MSNLVKTSYEAPAMVKIGDFETTTLSSTGSNKIDGAFTAAVGNNTLISIITSQGGSLAGLLLS